MRVKICGITNLQDAGVAVEAGADAFGLVFAESPRRVTPELAADIVASLRDSTAASEILVETGAHGGLGRFRQTQPTTAEAGAIVDRR